MTAIFLKGQTSIINYYPKEHIWLNDSHGANQGCKHQALRNGSKQERPLNLKGASSARNTACLWGYGNIDFLHNDEKAS